MRHPNVPWSQVVTRRRMITAVITYMELREIVPDADVLLSLEVEELAGVLLMHLNSGSGELHHYNFFNNLRNYPVYGDRAKAMNAEVNRALMEAWDWLLHEGFLAKK